MPSRIIGDGEHTFTVKAFNKQDKVIGEAQISGTIDNSRPVTEKIVYQLKNTCDLAGSANWVFLRGDKPEIVADTGSGCALKLDTGNYGQDGRYAYKTIRKAYDKVRMYLKTPGNMKAGDTVEIGAFGKFNRRTYNLDFATTLRFKAESIVRGQMVGKLRITYFNRNEEITAALPLDTWTFFQIEKLDGKLRGVLGTFPAALVSIDARNTHSARHSKGIIGAKSSVAGTLLKDVLVTKQVKKRGR